MTTTHAPSLYAALPDEQKLADDLDAEVLLEGNDSV
jgi:hypothetical protein